MAASVNETRVLTGTPNLVPAGENSFDCADICA